MVKDRHFLAFSGAVAVNTIVAAMMWQLLAVYSNTNYGISETLYGFLPTTNALMVVLFQYLVTRVTKRFPPVYMVAWERWCMRFLLAVWPWRTASWVSG